MGLLAVVLWSLCAWWVAAVLNAVLNGWLTPRLPREGGGLRDSLPSLSVVIPARNEAESIRATVEAHCRQGFPGLEVLVVDDGSTDGTPDILRDLEDRFGNLVVLRAPDPPRGWLGKVHALEVGLQRAKGNLVLFTDADVRYEPGATERAVAEFMARDCDMLLLLGRLEGRGLEHLVLSALDAVFFYVFPAFLANVPRFRRIAFGAGSGNLVRRETLLAAGCMGAIRSEVIDDAALGLHLKRSGARFRFVLAFDAIHVRMYEGLLGCLRGFTKNYFALFRFNPFVAAAVQGFDLSVHLLPILVLTALPVVPALAPLFPPAALSFALGLACNLASCLRAKRPLWVAFLYPFRPLLWTAVLLRSAWRYYTRGIEWRGRRYMA